MVNFLFLGRALWCHDGVCIAILVVEYLGF